MDGALKILKFGTKQIFLPKFTIALIRTPNLTPYHAKFRVPLSFSKFDLRDYLFHAYAVRTVNVRSSIKYLPVRNQEDNGRQLHRPEPEKYMTVEMDKPFVWPSDPENWEPWGKGEQKKDEKDYVNYMSESQEGIKVQERLLQRQALEVVAGEGAGVEGWERKRSGKYISAEEGRYRVKV